MAQVNWPCGFWENMFKYIIVSPILATLAEKSKADLGLGDLFVVIVSFSQTYEPWHVISNNVAFWQV